VSASSGRSKQWVKRVSALADSVWPASPGVVVLAYHRVGAGTASDVDLPLDEFHWQLEHLAHHHQVVTLDRAVCRLGEGAWGVDEPTMVAMTFDDGTADFAEHVVPALVRHGVPATLYVASQYVDEARPFPWGAPPVSWGALRDAVSTGLVDVGSHSHGHWLFDRLDAAQVAIDLDRSCHVIAEQLGDLPAHFAYPKALAGDAAVEVEVRRRFASAAVAGNRVNRPGAADLHRLGRSPVQRSDGHDHFVAKAAGGMRWEGAVRAAVLPLRLRGQRQ
jgi:hypothetical protein